MFRRDSHRERTLLRLIDAQQRQIERLENKLMYLCNRPWELPAAEVAGYEEEVEDPSFEIPELEAVDEAI
jgi:hypothetical protein